MSNLCLASKSKIRGDDDAVLGPGEVGELFVRGDQVSGKYAEIGSVLDEDGWFPTRDVAALDDEGYLFITGRSDDTIIRGGEHRPRGGGGRFAEHPSVRDVAVVGVEDSEWGQIIVAVVVPTEGAEPDPEGLRAHVRKSLRARHARPNRLP